MPTSFVPSFLTSRWEAGKNLPSSVFKPQINAETMLWKDVLPYNFDQDSRGLPSDVGNSFTPKHRPIESHIGCQIKVVRAEGVPMPKSDAKNSTFTDADIVKRALRFGIQARHRGKSS